MQYKVIPDEIAYSGRELRSGWVVQYVGAGDGAVGFIGPCNVANENLVDLDDQRAGTFIAAASMAHVLVEHPECPLAVCVLRQRLLVCILADLLRDLGVDTARDGDDLFVDGRKLTVSIAAPSAASSLIHLGVNIDPTGAPVPAIGLATLAVDPSRLLRDLLARYAQELVTVTNATTKVRAVR